MKFSIVTPVYNGEKYIEETIQSVLSQEGDFEIEYIIQDGGSNDNTIEIIKKYEGLLKEKKYPIRCNEITFSFVSEKDNGMYDAINKGFSQASGDIYAWLNSDDSYLPGAFQKIAKTFSTFQEIDWLKGNIFLIDENSEITGKTPCYIYNQDWIQLGIYGRYAYFISQESVFWRSSLWKKIGKIDEKFKLAGDYYLWTQFAKYAPLWSLDEPLSCFRKRPGQLSEDSKMYQKEQKIIVPPLKDFNTFIIHAFFWFRMKAPEFFNPFLFRLYKVLFSKRNRFYIEIENNIPKKQTASSFVIPQKKSKKTITRISGGVGNQMFQYATGLAVSKLNNAELLLDISFFSKDIPNETKRVFSLKNFNISGHIGETRDMNDIGLPDMVGSGFFHKLKRKCFRLLESKKSLYERKFIIEPQYQFCPEILKIKNSCYVSGVWQSEKYFLNVKDAIKKEFTLKNKPTEESEQWLKKIEFSNSVSLHIRRGDYITRPNTNEKIGVCPIEYYEKAMKFISEKIQDSVIFVFSDDMEWAKNNIKTGYSVYFVSDKNIPDYEELILMSKCRHNITANSSFSWWGAWLNENKDKIVVTPKKWFASNIDSSDLIPELWIQL